MLNSKTSSTSCCGSQVIPAEDDHDFSDQTLASCCERDLREQRYVAQTKATLLSVDRIDKRLRETKAVLGRTRVCDENITSDVDSIEGVSDQSGETFLIELPRILSKLPATHVVLLHNALLASVCFYGSVFPYCQNMWTIRFLGFIVKLMHW